MDAPQAYGNVLKDIREPSPARERPLASARPAGPSLLSDPADIGRNLREARCADEFLARIQRLLAGAGIRYFGHQLIARPADALDIFGTYPAKFLDEYARKQFYRDDLALLCARGALGSMAPLFQSDITRHLLASPCVSEQTQVNLDLAQVMDRCGLRETCSLYLHDANPEHRALLRLSPTDQPRETFRATVIDQLEPLRALGQTIGQIGWSKFKSRFHNPRQQPRRWMPPRPLQLLSLLMKDLSLNEAAEILEISISTANQHVALAKKVFKTTTIHGTILCAIREGLLEI